MRRQFNLAFFTRLLIDDDDGISGELAEPFDTLLGLELQNAVIASEDHAFGDAVRSTIRERNRLQNAPTPALLSKRGGFSPTSLVRLVGRLSNPS
jgi:hypothetical protein